MPIVIKMPGGDIEYVEAEELLWMRKAFPDERKDATTIRFSNRRLYSIESTAELSAKFKGPEAKLVSFTPPVGRLAMIVNVKSVKEVEPSNPIIFHEKANAILKFTPTIKLAVRETVAEAEEMLK